MLAVCKYVITKRSSCMKFNPNNPAVKKCAALTPWISHLYFNGLLQATHFFYCWAVLIRYCFLQLVSLFFLSTYYGPFSS